MIGGGTGFVVFPHYILTNNHVIDQGTSFEVQTGDSAQTVRLPARLVARSIKPDLALLYCEDLKAAPLAIDPATCGRGTDIMTLGYPEMFVLGASLKATRGVISAVPSSAIDDMYLYDAVVNHGNSGGPVCNRFGNVVAVTTIMVSTAGKYGGGIPGAAALAFVRQHVPGFHDAPRGASAMEWPAVDQVASPSTLLIWTRSQTPATSRPVVSTGIFEDRSCSECDGHGTVPCQCSVSGGARRRPVSAGVCRVCQGKKVVPCRVCNGKGIDPVFQPKEVTPKQPTPSAPPPRNGSTTINTQLDANLAASIAAAAREGRLQATKLLGAEKEGKQFGVSPADGGILVGLDPRRGPDGHVVGIRPVFQTARGLQMGQWHGSPPVSGELPHRILLRPGYAVAGLRIPQGESLDDLTVVLMRIDGDHLNPAERVEFRVTSAPPVGPFEEIGMTGSFFVGIVGKTATSPDNALLGLGLLSIKP
ncbi:MAG TPA: trypsin-like peptidase domain-containing protein [Pirellulales bacterium]|nr:trypsin-like peptidase domain-containing protein [Pirellulales bacterium]